MMQPSNFPLGVNYVCAGVSGAFMIVAAAAHSPVSFVINALALTANVYLIWRKSRANP